MSFTIYSHRYVNLTMLTGHYDEVPPPAHPRGRHRARRRPPLQSQQKVVSPAHSRNNSREPLYRTTSLETRSRTPSPHAVTSPTDSQLEYYGSVNLTDRSRSPSPDTARKIKAANKTRGGTRKLPAIPQKPHTLNLPKNAAAMPQMLPSPTLTKSASNINFPQLSASPTHRPRMPHPSRGRRERSMSPRRRRPYSPTDAQDLADAGMHVARNRAGRGDRLYSSQLLNNSSAAAADHRYTPPQSRDNRHGDDIQVVHVAGRQVPSGLPNGYKPGQVSGRTPDLHLRKQVQPAPPPDEQSDSEDEDWC